MLIRFRVKNFLSFQDEVELSMIPGKTRQHPAHIFSGGESRHAVDLLRGAVVYGANASGKSNLIKAIDFARQLVLEGTKAKQAIPTRPFKLDAQSRLHPSQFEFEIRSNGNDYLYGFAVTAEQVVSEWLYLLRLTTQERMFERQTSPSGQTTVAFEKIPFASKKEQDFLEFVAMGTRPNQLFLTEAIEKNSAHFQPLHHWFANTLQIVFPATSMDVFQREINYEQLAGYLEKLGTGIYEIEKRKTVIVGEKLKSLHENPSTSYRISQQPVEISVAGGDEKKMKLQLDADGNLVQEELIFRHRAGGEDAGVEFWSEEESDGSLRLVDLIPLLFLHEDSEKVVFIDELDRSLHPNLCYKLLDLFLNNPELSSQIIVTTHESILLTFDLLRRDEIWFTEKDQHGMTKLYSLEEFTPRYDKDIEKGYLLGRFGAIPIIGKKPF